MVRLLREVADLMTDITHQEGVTAAGLDLVTLTCHQVAAQLSHMELLETLDLPEGLLEQRATVELA